MTMTEPRMLRLPDYDNPGVRIFNNVYVSFNDEPGVYRSMSGYILTGADYEQAKRVFAEGN